MPCFNVVMHSFLKSGGPTRQHSFSIFAENPTEGRDFPLYTPLLHDEDVLTTEFLGKGSSSQSVRIRVFFSFLPLPSLSPSQLFKLFFFLDPSPLKFFSYFQRVFIHFRKFTSYAHGHLRGRRQNLTRHAPWKLETKHQTKTVSKRG